MVGVNGVINFSYLHVYIVMILGGTLIVVPSSAVWRTCIFLNVDLTPCILCLMYPFWVYYASRNSLFVALTVNPGHVA